MLRKKNRCVKILYMFFHLFYFRWGGEILTDTADDAGVEGRGDHVRLVLGANSALQSLHIERVVVSARDG